MTQSIVALLRCSTCKKAKPASEFHGSAKGRPSYRCTECSGDLRVRMTYRKQIAAEPIGVSELNLRRKYQLAKMFEEELTRFKTSILADEPTVGSL